MTTKTLPRLLIFSAISNRDPSSPAIIHSTSGRTFTYGQLLQDVAKEKDKLFGEAAGNPIIKGKPVAFLVENSYDYVVTLLSIFGAHSIALPLSPAFPTKELQYIMRQSGASLLLSPRKFEVKAREVLEEDFPGNPRFVGVEKKLPGKDDGDVKVILEGDGETEGGMMLYTSGTTNRPKGVLLPQSALTAQSQSLQSAWQYTSQDHLLHVLPLHHIHGTVNAILTPLLSGSTIEFLFPFNATSVWSRFATPFLPTSPSPSSPSPTKKPITFFTVVPTIYKRLLSTFPTLPLPTQKAAKQAISPPNLRLCISGSAALPTPIKKAWTDLSDGNVLLERYGMTEIGMALSCGLSKEERMDGSVGWVLPGVEVRLDDLENGEVIREGEEMDEEGRERDGEIQIRGATVFREYWGMKEATEREFVDDDGDGGGKWFRTGDVAVRRMGEGVGESKEKEGQDWTKGGMYFIRGRKSADIIKSGGEKVSALEVEREILSLPEIEECAVVAIPSGSWGQKVGAVVILKSESKPNELSNQKEKAKTEEKTQKQRQENEQKVGAVIVLKGGVEGKKGGSGSWGAMDLRRALRDRLANYKIPRVIMVVDDIPKNAMGKINKKELVKSVFEGEISGDEL